MAVPPMWVTDAVGTHMHDQPCLARRSHRSTSSKYMKYPGSKPADVLEGRSTHEQARAGQPSGFPLSDVLAISPIGRGPRVPRPDGRQHSVPDAGAQRRQRPSTGIEPAVGLADHRPEGPRQNVSIGGVEQEVDALRSKEQVGVADEQVRRLGICGAEIGSGAVPEIASGAQQPHAVTLSRSFRCAVGGAVVCEDDLVRHAARIGEGVEQVIKKLTRRVGDSDDAHSWSHDRSPATFSNAR